MSVVDPDGEPPRRRRRALRAPAPRRILRALPTPLGTPFTFFYGLVLLATAIYTDYGDQATVNELLRESSTDAAHLVEQPLVVLLASALWIAGGLYSLYGIVFVLVVSALERRTGGARTAGVFLLGHVLATLATELPVAGAVAAGQLPEASLHRLDYGISFGVMACIGALAGLLGQRAKWTVLGISFLMCAQDLVEFADPLASWGHPIALLTGMACWGLLRDKEPARGGSAADGAVPGPVRAPRQARQGRPAGAPQQRLRGGAAGRGVREEPLDGGRAELVRQAVAAGEDGGEAEAARDVVRVEHDLRHPHGGEAGRVGVAPRVPGADPLVRAADGRGQQRRSDADALQAGR
ncbi:rhomboid-like protein [Streptomyces hiroshimensis]|uniref:rhomboid-like protein n=1 Tax=Streptomyces hiroshimensis TaxID=66424 RepID=UPI0016750C7B|nr:rhomboid-like protein [Streptomyces hiroshimensis]